MQKGTELTINMNCGFDLIELDTLFFWNNHAYISLSMSGSVAASISCMLAKNFTGFKHKIHIASDFTDVIVNTQLHHV